MGEGWSIGIEGKENGMRGEEWGWDRWIGDGWGDKMRVR